MADKTICQPQWTQPKWAVPYCLKGLYHQAVQKRYMKYVCDRKAGNIGESRTIHLWMRLKKESKKVLDLDSKDIEFKNSY